tara:strand:+ start:205 stop:843 length:639 start_codon:yes stop_codon:yes gene_type:complete
MYQNNKQVGRVRINKINEGRLRKKTHVQKKTLKKSRLHVLLDLQNKLFKEGLNHMEYCKYTQTKINDNKYHYRGLSENDFIYLKDRYSSLINRETNQYNEIGYIKEINRKKRKQFRKKKSRVIYEKRTELIKELLTKMRKGNTNGILKSNESLSIDPNNWDYIKRLLFLGGRYIDTHDKEWTPIYKKLVSMGVYHLFNLHSNESLNEYIFNH